MSESNGATRCEFYVEGGKELGSFLLYNPPVIGDDLSFGEAMYTVARRNYDVHDARIRITVRVKDAT
jgi:hypothetical protein